MTLARQHPIRFGYVRKDRVLVVAMLVDAVERVAAAGAVLDPDVVACPPHSRPLVLTHEKRPLS